MGIYIKNIEMPQSCWDCKFCLDFEFLLPYVCAAANKEFENGIEEYAHSRPNWCPLVAIPPHGRLIDADALLEHMKKIHDKWKMEGHYTPTTDDEILVMYMPTIIEAEVDE